MLLTHRVTIQICKFLTYSLFTITIRIFDQFIAMSISTSRSRSVLKLIASPAKVASSLEWRRKCDASIMMLDIGRNVIGIAVASHPSNNIPIKHLDPLDRKLETKSNLKRRVLAPDILNKLQSIVRKYDVCGFLISWPVQKVGRCGASCGLVLHALDSIIAESSSILTPNRPFCLWDSLHIEPCIDEWDRSPLYSKPCLTNEPTAIECNHEKESSEVATNIWADFCEVYWPKEQRKNHQRKNINEIEF